MGEGPVETSAAATEVAAAQSDETPEHRPSAKELILTALRDRGPLSTSTLDEVIMKEGGWTKLAADKAKMFSKRDGLTTSDKRIWSTLAKGKAELLQIEPKT